jgi:hypothetical protein
MSDITGVVLVALENIDVEGHGVTRKLAGRTGLEPATSGVTGRRSNQLNYHPD